MVELNDDDDTKTRPPWMGAAMLATTAAVVIVVLSVAVWGCGSNDADLDVGSGATGSNSADGTPALDATSWLLVSGTGPDGEVPIVDGWPITLTFGSDTIGGTAACNSFGGRYRLDGTTFTTDEMAQTEMACIGDRSGDGTSGGEVMQSEARFMAALAAADRLDIVGDRLTLTGPASELLFILETPVPAAELVGQVWLLDTIVDGDAASTVTGNPATVLLRPDGTVQGSTGCRQFTGDYVIDGASVRFTSLAMSGECAPDIERQDNHVVTVLGDGFGVEIDGDRLWLSSQGNLGLGYRAVDVAPELAPTPAATLDDAPMSLNELLDDQRRDPVLVEGRLLYSGGSWILCDEIDLATTPRCAGRWVVVNNYADVVNPHTEPPTSIADAAFSLAEVNPDFVAQDDAVYTPRPQQLLIQLIDDGRAVVPAWPSGTDVSESDSELISAFIRFGAGASVDTGPQMLSDTVVLGLSDQIIATRTADELADPAAWQLDAEAFRGRVGPFSALELLGTAGQGRTLVGRHDHCAAPPAPIPGELQDARQLSFQPTGIDSCIEWWTVDLFLDADGQVIAITLDLWEP
jgi:heat shock protein HslJ